ncbi:MAG: flagellar export chaperone FliS [Desulfamplus sp.]|nr:flagellar export chaperone FliS [Desulfamplus sp.]
MRPNAGMQKYMNNHYEGMSPEQLILMLYKGALFKLQLVKQGIEENNIQKRGENLSKVISIIAELNASINPDIADESTNFLRGLYSAILIELPKVSLTNDIEIVNRTERYISKLKDIWENDVMGKKAAPVAKPSQRASAVTEHQKRSFLGMLTGSNSNSSYGPSAQPKLQAFAV